MLTPQKTLLYAIDIFLLKPSHPIFLWFSAFKYRLLNCTSRQTKIDFIFVGPQQQYLKVHKREKFFVSDFEFFTILQLVKLKY
jgi:hypothetical protein